MVNYEEIKSKIEANIKKYAKEVGDLSDYLADHPEVSAEEYESSRLIVELLKSKGFDTVYPYDNIPTAFKASYGKGNHNHKVALLTEYDALPEIGHACGHCLSAGISILAGLAVMDLQDELDCDFVIFGTPEEEVDGAKCRMADHGAFDDFDMAIMIHLYDQNLAYCKLLALNSFMYTFHGKAAHASAAPWEGLNALNGAQLMMHAVDMMRQHVTPDVRMHAVYRNGGAAPNIVPEEASIEIFARALDRPYLNTILERITDCARGAAIATGTTFDVYETSHPYDNLVNLDAGVNAVKEVFDELGIDLNGDHDQIFGSSDIGNVSFRCPTFHPTLQLVERGVPIHTREFEAAVKTDKAHDIMAQGAEVIALQAVKLVTDEDTNKALKAEFVEKVINRR